MLPSLSFALLLTSQANLQISSGPLPTAVVDRVYCDSGDIRFEATGGAEPYTWSVDPSTPLPAGFTLSVDGLLCGVPQRVDRSAIIVRVDDVTGRFDTNTFFIDVETDAFVISTFSVGGIVGRAFDESLNTILGDAPVQWTMLPTSQLPSGLSVTADGRVVGTTNEAGAFPLAVDAVDARGATRRGVILVQVLDIGGTPPDGGVTDADGGVSLDGAVPATDGAVPTTDGGVAPDGGGMLDVPTQREDGCGCSASPRDAEPPAGPWALLLVLAIGWRRRRWIGWCIALAIALAPEAAMAQDSARIESRVLADATIDVDYDTQLGLVQPQPGTWIIELGQLPPGVSLAPDGRIFGRPQQVGRFRFVVQFRTADIARGRDSDSFELIVRDDGALQLETDRLPTVLVTEGYDVSTGPVGGIAPFEYRFVAGRLPDGLSASTDVSTGRLRIAGQASTAGARAFLLEVTDANGRTAVRPYVIWVKDS